MSILWIIVLGIAIFFLGGIVGCSIVAITQSEWNRRKTNDVYKYEALFNFATDWIKKYQKKERIGKELYEKGYRKVAIYGMQRLGYLLKDELEENNIVVKYGIDRNADLMYSDLKIVTPDENIEEVDLIIVTAVASYDAIYDSFKERTDIPICNLKSLL